MTPETIIAITSGAVVQAIGIAIHLGVQKRAQEDHERRLGVLEDDSSYQGQRTSHIEGYLSVAPPPRRVRAAGR